jgi:hypothetical protein
MKLVAKLALILIKSGGRLPAYFCCNAQRTHYLAHNQARRTVRPRAEAGFEYRRPAETRLSKSLCIVAIVIDPSVARAIVSISLRMACNA